MHFPSDGCSSLPLLGGWSQGLTKMLLPGGHLHAGCCSLVHLVSLKDSNLPTSKGFPGIPQGIQRSESSIFMQEGWGTLI